MDVPTGSHANLLIQVSFRTEHNNQQWTFLPVFGQLPSTIQERRQSFSMIANPTAKV